MSDVFHLNLTKAQNLKVQHSLLFLAILRVVSVLRNNLIIQSFLQARVNLHRG